MGRNWVNTKNIMVTGAAGGIGQRVVRAALEQGATVWAVDRSKSALLEMEQQAASFGQRLCVEAVDLTDTAAMTAAVHKVMRTAGRLHCSIHSAGIAGMSDFQKQSVQDFDRVMDVNFRAAVCLTRLVLPHMQAQGGGVVVQLGSIAGFVPAPLLAAYSSSKHALVGFTRAVREELRLQRSNVRLVLVSPGFVDTPLVHGQPVEFPPWLRWALVSPDRVATQIIRALGGGPDELWPGWNGRLMHGLHRLFPQATRRRADLLLARSFRDWVLNRYEVE